MSAVSKFLTDRKVFCGAIFFSILMGSLSAYGYFYSRMDKSKSGIIYELREATRSVESINVFLSNSSVGYVIERRNQISSIIEKDLVPQIQRIKSAFLNEKSVSFDVRKLSESERRLFYSVIRDYPATISVDLTIINSEMGASIILDSVSQSYSLALDFYERIRVYVDSNEAREILFTKRVDFTFALGRLIVLTAAFEKMALSSGG